jgi:hypothetical protein
MRTILAALLLAGLAGSGARAETNEQRGKRVADEALAALGGQAFLAMQDRTESGRAYSFYREKLSGLALARIYTRYLAAPESQEPGSLRVREREALGKKQEDVILFTQDTAYELTFRGARPLADKDLQRFKESTLRNIFYILRERLSEPGLFFESRGSDFYENRPVEIVDVVDANNDTVTVYFDQMTKLPTRQRFFRRDPIDNSRLEEVSIFAKYRDVGGGVMWPFSIRRERNGEKIFEMYSESVEINQDLREDLFTLPANLKILPKQK